MRPSIAPIVTIMLLLGACVLTDSTTAFVAPRDTQPPSPSAAASLTHTPAFTPTATVPPSPTSTPTSLPTNTPIPTPTATPTQVFDTAKLGTIERDLTYCTIEGIGLKMDIYYPDYGGDPWPVVVYVHGGRWTAGDKATGAGLRYFEALLEERIMVVSVNYRLAPEHIFPAPLEDIKCAVRHLRANASYYNLNPLRIGALGTSAGGHLTSLLALVHHGAGYDSAGGYQDTYSRIQAVASLYAPSDFTISCKNDLVKLIFGASNCKDIGTLLPASPLSYVGAAAPPFLLMHGDRDQVVPIKHSRVLYRALTAASAPSVTLIEVENAGHGFQSVSGRIDPSKSEIAKILIDFFVRYLK